MRYLGGVVRNSELPAVGGLTSLFARAIKEATEDAGLSGSEVARRLGRAQSYVSLRMNGRKSWTLDELEAIAEMLGLTSYDLIDRARGK